MPAGGWGIFSAIIGWVYFAAWSISFYPQIYENWKRKSVVGLSFDYEVYNITGYICYSVYNISFYFSSYVQELYFNQYGTSNAVQPNDVFFALHAVIVTAYILFQIVIYEKGDQKISLMCKVLTALTWITILILGIITAFKRDLLFFYLYFFATVKLSISFIKYCPQVYLNWKRKSTVGWNIYNVLLDIFGGLLSIVQLVMDCWLDNNWAPITGDFPKLLLGSISIFFDIIFIIQHYVLYNKNSYKNLTENIEDGYISQTAQDELNTQKKS